MKAPTRSEAQKRALRELEHAKRKRRDAENTLQWSQTALAMAKHTETAAMRRALDLGAIKK